MRLIRYCFAGLLIVIAGYCVNRGIEINSTETYAMSNVECYEEYSGYFCDFLWHEKNEYITKRYHRQAYKEMMAGVGTKYMIEVKNDAKVGAWISAVVLLLIALIVWPERRLRWE